MDFNLQRGKSPDLNPALWVMALLGKRRFEGFQTPVPMLPLPLFGARRIKVLDFIHSTESCNYFKLSIKLPFEECLLDAQRLVHITSFSMIDNVRYRG